MCVLQYTWIIEPDLQYLDCPKHGALIDCTEICIATWLETDPRVTTSK